MKAIVSKLNFWNWTIEFWMCAFPFICIKFDQIFTRCDAKHAMKKFIFACYFWILFNHYMLLIWFRSRCWIKWDDFVQIFSKTKHRDGCSFSITNRINISAIELFYWHVTVVFASSRPSHFHNNALQRAVSKKKLVIVLWWKNAWMPLTSITTKKLWVCVFCIRFCAKTLHFKGSRETKKNSYCKFKRKEHAEKRWLFVKKGAFTKVETVSQRQQNANFFFRFFFFCYFIERNVHL